VFILIGEDWTIVSRIDFLHNSIWSL
jgi:hypothetical protein